jgi:hypothetical protein
MKLFILAPSSFVSSPLPLHAWPDPIKRILLTFMVVILNENGKGESNAYECNP